MAIDLAGLEVADSTLQNCHLGKGIPSALELGPDLVLQVRGIPHLLDEELKKPLGRKKALGFQFLHDVVADWDVGAPNVQDDLVVMTVPESLEP